MTNKQHIKVIIAGGGTGGHVFPAIAIAQALKRADANTDILFVGALGKIEMQKVPSYGFEIVGLNIAGFDRKSLLKNVTLPWKLIKSLWQCRGLLSSFKPDIVVGVGGYASFPMLYIAQLFGIKTLIQEQNSFAGKSNKILAKKADAICVAYQNMERFFPKEKIVLTGNPIRSIVRNVNNITREQACIHFRLEVSKKIILIIGGSLGAKSINDTLQKQYRDLTDSNLQLIWQTGSISYESVKSVIANHPNIYLSEFISEMDMAFAAADIIVSRSGASSISELTLVAKPVIFVPYPYASEDHQTSNALALKEKKAALIVKNSETDGKLINTILNLVNDEATCNTMSSQLSLLNVGHADEKIADIILKITSHS